MMRSFTLLEPRSVEAACEALAQHEDSRPIAGGTSFVIMMKQGFLAPDVLVNLAKIPVRGTIEVADDEVCLDAFTTISRLEADESLRRLLPVLVAACHVVANIRIRNVATLGGNVAHADYQADPPTALLALDAALDLRTAEGQRSLTLDDFLFGIYSTALQQGEIVESIRVPVPSPMSWTYDKFKTRSSEDRPTAGVAVGLRTEGGVCAELRIAVGAATARPIRFRDLEASAAGVTVEDVFADELAGRVATSIDPVEDLNGDATYKRRIVHAVVRRAIMRCRDGEATR
jgi:carbon-monoxide dehydrogenase medium subunit